MKQMQLRFILVVVASVLLLISLDNAFGDTNPPVKTPKKAAVKKRVKKAKTASPRYAPKPPPTTSSPGIPALPDNTLAMRSAAPAAPAVTSSFSLTDDTPSRILNLRIHPLYLAEMLFQRNTLVSLRGDMDFVLGDRFTLGPSIIYQQTSNVDETALASGTSQMMNESFLEVGLLANIYLTGTTSTGGFLLRPHAYWIDPTGEKDPLGGGSIGSTSVTQGVRSGAEFIYQKILPNGFNFEVGGGFTYYLVPYEIDYPASSGTTATIPTSRIQPTLSLAIGWAF